MSAAHESLPDHPTQTDYWANQADTITKKQRQNTLFRLSAELPFGLRVYNCRKRQFFTPVASRVAAAAAAAAASSWASPPLPLPSGGLPDAPELQDVQNH